MMIEISIRLCKTEPNLRISALHCLLLFFFSFTLGFVVVIVVHTISYVYKNDQILS